MAALWTAYTALSCWAGCSYHKDGRLAGPAMTAIIIYILFIRKNITT